jgi:hypothetical protein
VFQDPKPEQTTRLKSGGNRRGKNAADLQEEFDKLGATMKDLAK